MKRLIIPLLCISLNALALEIYPLVSGKINMIKAVGSAIKQGDLLVQIDDTEAKLELDYLLALQRIHQQNLDDKQLELQQTKELYERLVASYRDLEIIQLAFNRAKQEMDAHNAKIKIVEHKLSQYQIHAPTDGTIKALPNRRNVTNIHAPKVLMVIEQSDKEN